VGPAGSNLDYKPHWHVEQVAAVTRRGTNQVAAAENITTTSNRHISEVLKKINMCVSDWTRDSDY
jgi:hypothetical protein